MRTEVWQKLPAGAPAEMGSDIISWTYGAACCAAAYVPPLPRQKGKVLDHLSRYPPVSTAENASIRADLLTEAMSATEGDAAERWADLWEGDATVTFDKANMLVKHIGNFYRAFNEETMALVKAVGLPKIRKKNAPKAREWIFSL
jgi:hypothetical protein